MSWTGRYDDLMHVIPQMGFWNNNKEISGKIGEM